MRASDNFEIRRVRIHTATGTVDGSLRASPMLRTLDELNLVSRNFLTVHDPDLSASSLELTGKSISINRASILFVHELSGSPTTSGKKVGGTFTRAAVQIQLGEFEVEGFLHVPPGGDVMKRLNHTQHPFLSLTSVSVLGRDTHFATPFLALNFSHILAAQEVVTVDPEVDSEDDVTMSFELES